MFGIVLFVIILIIFGFTGQMVYLGNSHYVGPFKFLNINRLVNKYADRPEGEIIFYGGSNFRRWVTVEEDLPEFPIQNRAFGGSDDIQRFREVDRLIYPAKPSIIAYMSSSNDWTGGRTAQEIIAYKENLFNTMSERLPDTVFIILSSTPNPKRYFGEYHNGMMEVNAWVEEYCASRGNFVYLDVVTPMTNPDGTVNTAIWGDDDLHLNNTGYRLLTKVMQSALTQVCEEYDIAFDR